MPDPVVGQPSGALTGPGYPDMSMGQPRSIQDFQNPCLLQVKRTVFYEESFLIANFIRFPHFPSATISYAYFTLVFTIHLTYLK